MAKQKRNYNTVLNIEDYIERGYSRRKEWEIGIALDTLRENGAVHDEAFILGVGAGNEPTIYHLTNETKMVFATDIYLDSGAWNANAPIEMLEYPQYFAGDIKFDCNRLVVQHMDGRFLNYPDNFFDGIFSSGSIEHFGGWDDIAQSAREMGRVLKQGGILSLSTEFKISGEGDGWDGVKLLSAEDLDRYIIKPSGLTLIDEPNYTVNEQTLAHEMTLLEAIAIKDKTQIETVLNYNGFQFTSVHLALRKE